MSLQAPSTAETEQYRVLRHIVETLRKRTNLQILAVTSPGNGDSKSMTAINLAGAPAQSEDARVLLADMDLGHPSIARYLALSGSRPTLADALGPRGLALKDAVVQVPRFNLSDTPPFVPVPDSRLIARCVDGFVVVVASNRTQRRLLAETLKAIDPEKTVGSVFNADPTLPASDYDYDYGNGHGKTRPWRRKGESS